LCPLPGIPKLKLPGVAARGNLLLGASTMRFSHGQRGQVLPMVAIAAVALLGFAALAADVGYDRFQQRLQQTAADSAAIAGATERAAGHMRTAAQADAAKNGFTDSETGTPPSCHASETCVVVNNPPTSGNYTGDNTAVEVLISKPYPRFFQRVFGSDDIKFTTRAVARLVSGSVPGCVYMLDATANTNYNKDTSVTATNCTMYFNGSINTNSASISAQQIEIRNLAGSNIGANVTPTPVSLSAPADDPCPQIDSCAYLTANPPSTSSCGNLTVTNASMNPGCYNNVTMGGTVTMNPGLYVVTGTWKGPNGSSSAATLTGTGVTMYVTSSGLLNFNNVNTGPLTAPTSGNYNGMLIYQVPGNTGVNFNQSINDLTGVLYMPSACPNWNKSGSGYTMLVFRCANFNKGSETFGAPPGGGAAFIKDAVLAE